MISTVPQLLMAMGLARRRASTCKLRAWAAYRVMMLRARAPTSIATSLVFVLLLAATTA
ncbi:hypothetical protein STENM327S_05178 [Streptomyces tendae]